MLHHLNISVAEPDAALQVKRWRAQCRRARRTSVVVVRFGEVFYLEVRETPNNLAPLHLDMIREHPDFEFAGSGSSSGSERCFSAEGMPVANLEKILRLIEVLLETCQSDEMRLSLRRAKDPIAPIDEPEIGQSFCVSLSCRSYTMSAPNLQLSFPDREYKCWQDSLLQLFEGLPRPLPICRRAAGRQDLWTNPEDLAWRFPGLCPEASRTWLEGFLPFQIDSLRFDPGTVSLQDEGILLSRPGFSQDGQEAVFWLSGPLLSGPFQGLVRVELGEQGWRVKERSYDEDWERLSFETHSGSHFRFSERPHRNWRWASARFNEPDPCDRFCPPEELETINSELAALIQNGDERCVIPMLHGPPLSIAQLKREGEILWSCQPSKVTEALARAGQAIVRWGDPGSPQWLGKLLHGLDQQIPCRRLESVWAEAPAEDRTEPHRKSLLQLLEAIFARAGCLGLRCRHTANNENAFGWQAEAGTPMRILGTPCVFDQSGTLWLHISHRGFSDGIFEILGSLCSWGDTEARWTERLWRAAVLESAWSRIETEN